MRFQVPKAPTAVLSLVLLAWLAASCSVQRAPLAPAVETDVEVDAASSPEAPDGPSLAAERRGFFPLALGNRWHYAGLILEDAAFDDGTAFHSDRRYRMQSELICQERIGDRDYLVSRDRRVFAGQEEYTEWIRYRQDRGGLFEADLATSEAPGCETLASPRGGAVATDVVSAAAAPAFADPAKQAAYASARHEAMAKLELARRLLGWGSIAPLDRRGASPEGVAIGELTRLAYPLHIGARWLIRSDPRFASHVVAHETIELRSGREAGWKVRITSELFGPDDRVRFWVNRHGFLKYAINVSGIITGPSGEPIGTITASERRELIGYRLHRPSDGAGASTEPVTAGIE